jgi:hypothetical protein
MFDEILMYKKARKMQHSQTEKGVKQENENHTTCMANPLNNWICFAFRFVLVL